MLQSIVQMNHYMIHIVLGVRYKLWFCLPIFSTNKIILSPIRWSIFFWLSIVVRFWLCWFKLLGRDEFFLRGIKFFDLIHFFLVGKQVWLILFIKYVIIHTIDLLSYFWVDFLNPIFFIGSFFSPIPFIIGRIRHR